MKTALTIIGLIAVYGFIGTIDYADAKAAEAHRKETIAAAKQRATLEKQAHSMLSLDRMYAITGETK